MAQTRIALRESAFLVLTALAGGPRHGYPLIEIVERLSEGRVRLRTGTVYSVLERLRESGLIEVEREEVVASRLRRYYQLTPTGEAVLRDESSALRRRADVADDRVRMPAQTRGRVGPSADPHPGRSPAPAGRLVHRALFYRDLDQYLAGALPFVIAALQDDEPVAVLVPADRLALLRTRLGRWAAQVRLVDATSAGRNPAWVLPAVLLAFAEAHAGRPMRIVGELIWPSRTPIEYPACVQHEALINLAFAGCHATILCLYDAANLDDRVLRDAARTHPVLCDETGRRVSDAYDPREAFDAYNLPLTDDDLGAVEEFPLDAASLPRAPAFAAGMAIRHGVPAARRADVELVVAELAADSVRHGGGTGRLSVGVADGYVMCQVRDRRPLVDPFAGRRLVPDGQTSGRGLLLVNRSADLVRTHIVEGHTTTRAYFDINP